MSRRLHYMCFMHGKYFCIFTYVRLFSSWIFLSFFLLFSIRFISLNSFHYLILIASNVYIIYIHFRAIKREVVERKLQSKAKRAKNNRKMCDFFLFIFFGDRMLRKNAIKSVCILHDPYPYIHCNYFP